MKDKGTLIRGTIGNSQVRFFAIDSTNMTKKMRATHSTSYTATVALGQLITAGAMMGAMLKNDDDVNTITVNGNGAGGTMVCSAFSGGMVKGYTSNPEVELAQNADGTMDTRGYIGTDGRLSILRDMGFGQPYTGQCPMRTGDLAQDIAYYYLKSEQVPSLVALGVSFDTDGSISKSGGVILQALPDCSDDLIGEIELRSMMLSDISRQLEVMTLEEFMTALFGDLDINISETTYPYYGCDCSDDRIQRVLMSMGESELLDLANSQDNTNILCHFCQKEYSFDKDSILNLIKIGKQ